jgi:hypothetical protein
VTNVQNDVSADVLSIDFKQNNEGTAIADGAIEFPDSLIVFTDAFSYAAPASPGAQPVKSNVVNYELKTPATIATYRIKITGDAEFTNFRVDSTTLPTITLFGSSTIASKFTLSFEVKNEENTGAAIISGGLNADVAKGDLVAGTVYTVNIIATASGETVGQFDGIENMASAEPPKQASDYQTALNGQHFTIAFKVFKPTA